MKLRLKDNTMRIRLSTDEVDTLLATGHIMSRTAFPGQNFLKTEVHLDSIDKPFVSFEQGKISLIIPKLDLVDWQQDTQVGHHWEIGLDDGDHLTIYLEKDFRCLTERPGEDESALYPNPRKSHG